MADDKELIKELEAKARIMRRDAVEMIRACGCGWVGGSFSQADILAALVFHHIRHDPANPQWADRDRLIVSKAHCAETVYAALGEAGYFPKKEFQYYGKYRATLQPHTERSVPGVEYSGGSLGQGLSFALGEALAARIGAPRDESGQISPRFRVFCIIGDGECDEGQIWEAVMAAAQYQADNLVAIVDHNKFQSSGKVTEKINLEPLPDKWLAFRWDVAEIDGHDFNQILGALRRADEVRDKPHVIIAHTIKGKGVPSFESRNPHFCAITDEMYADAMAVLE